MGRRNGRVSAKIIFQHTITAAYYDLRVSVLIRNMEDIPDPSSSTAGQVLYFEVLELQPILLAISFMRTERVSSEQKYVIEPLLPINVLTSLQAQYTEPAGGSAERHDDGGWKYQRCPAGNECTGHQGHAVEHD